MAQKMTLTGYLAQRGVKAKALTKGEAELLGIPYPLRAGWPRRHGAMEIEEEMLARLVACVEGIRRAAEEKARSDRAKVKRSTPVGCLELTKLPAFPGFVLRRPKRY
jgi:hypothetical protein